MEKEKGVELVARFGFAAKGVVYVVVGVLAAISAMTVWFGAAGGAKDAATLFNSGIVGRIGLLIVGVGLFGYAFWKGIQATLDPENEADDDTKGVARRLSSAAGALIYGSLGVYAIKLFAHLGASRGGESRAESWSEQVLTWPAGRYIVMAGGVIVIGYGIVQAYRGYHDKFMEKLDEHDMSSAIRSWIKGVGTFGLFGRAVVFAIIGSLIIYAGFTYNPEAARGVAGGLRWLESQPWGSYLLAAVGIAFLCYGLLCFAKSRYRRLDFALDF